MVKVGCAGYPMPLGRYYRLFRAVEIIDTELGIPRAGTMRRWKREAPKGSSFSLLAPPLFGETGFAKTKENLGKLEELRDFASELGAEAVVFRGPESFGVKPANERALYAFLGALPEGFPAAVIELPSWSSAQIVSATRGRGTAARDPLSDGPPEKPEPLTYFRLPGPAGQRSRYDPAALEDAAQAIRATPSETVFCIFGNADMETNGTALIELLSE